MGEKVYFSSNTDGLSKTEKELIEQLLDAEPVTRLRAAINLTKSGHGDIVARIPGLQEQVRAAMSQEGNLSFDSTRAVAVPIGGISMEKA